jgi:hypothetical protein
MVRFPGFDQTRSICTSLAAPYNSGSENLPERRENASLAACLPLQLTDAFLTISSKITRGLEKIDSFLRFNSMIAFKRLSPDFDFGLEMVQLFPAQGAGRMDSRTLWVERLAQ